MEDNSKKNGNHNIVENESIIKTEEVDLSSSDQVEQPAELEVEPPTEPEVEPSTEPEVEPPIEPDVEEESAKSCQSYDDVEVSKENNSSEEQTKVEENSCEAQTSLPPEVKEETESEDRQSLAESLMEDEDDQNDNTDAASSTVSQQNIQNLMYYFFVKSICNSKNFKNDFNFMKKCIYFIFCSISRALRKPWTKMPSLRLLNWETSLGPGLEQLLTGHQ